MCLLSEMKIKKQSKRSQVGLGTHFPCDVPGPPTATPSSPSRPICSPLCRGGLSGGVDLYGIKTAQHIEAPMVSHQVCIFLHFAPQGNKETDGGRLLVPGQLAGFSFPVFSKLLTSLKSSPSSCLCCKTLLTLRGPSPGPRPSAPSNGCVAHLPTLTDHPLPLASSFISWSDYFLSHPLF